MSVYLRKNRRRDGSTWTSWYYQFVYNWKQFKKGGFVSEKDAKKAERKRKYDVEFTQTHVLPDSKKTFNDICANFLENRKVIRAQSTWIAESHRILVLKRRFGEKVISKITTDHVHRFMRERRAAGKAVRTINLDILLLRAVLDYAVDLEIIPSNPAKRVRCIPENIEEKWIPKNKELSLFLSEAKKTKSTPVLVPWLHLMIMTGMRPSEALHLEWDDINFEQNQIVVKPKEGNPGKTRRFRYVPMHRELKPVLLGYREYWDKVQLSFRKKNPHASLHNWVFFNPCQPGHRAHRFYRSFERAKTAANLPQLTPNTLRHFFISSALAEGMPPLSIARIVGHRTTRMIELTYGHLREDYLADSINMLSPLMEKEEGEIIPMPKRANAS